MSLRTSSWVVVVVRQWTAVLIAILAWLSGGLLQAQQPASLTNGLVAYYPFDGDANDVSGYNNQGVLFSASLTFDRFSFSKSAYYFDSSIKSAINTKSPGLLPGQGSRSFCVWYKQSSRILRDFTHAPLLSVGDASDSDCFRIEFWGDSLQVIQSSQGKFTGAYKAFEGLMQPMTDMKWHQLVVVIKDSDIFAYIDGVPTVWAVLPPPGTQWSLPNEDLWIGYAQGSYFDGELDDVRAYNRALSGTEVAALFNYERTAPFRTAIATLQIANGFVIGAKVTDGGIGYKNIPNVMINGLGSGASAIASVANGVVTGITVINAGHGYDLTSTLTIDPPPFPPSQAKGTATLINGFVTGVNLSLIHI
jgi:hypothetical protein